LKVIGQEKDVPLVVIVLLVVALKVSVPVPVHVVSAVRLMLPEISIVPVDANVQPMRLTVMSRQVKAPVRVTVPGTPLPASKNTLFVAVGTDAPEAPPEDVDQTVVEDVSHVPAPPTQYLFSPTENVPDDVNVWTV